MRGASEIEHMYRAVAQVKHKYYNHRYLNSEIYLPPVKIKRALLDFTELGRILNRELTVVGEQIYDCCNVDIEILEGGLYGDFELCILDDYEVPFQRHMRGHPEKKEVMRRFSIIACNYMTLLAPHMDSMFLEVGDFEDQHQIDTAKRAGCDCIITSDHHLLQLTAKKPVGITPEAFAKLCGISFEAGASFLRFAEGIPEKEEKNGAHAFAGLSGAPAARGALGY